MTPEFTPISINYAKAYKELLNKTNASASDYSFGNIWGWSGHYGLEWMLQDGLCWIRQNFQGTTIYWAPVGDWKNYIWTTCGQMEQGREFIRVPEELAEHWKRIYSGRIEITESRGQWDYLYTVEDLAKLPGNRYHKKKNHLNQFKKLYAFTYQAMTPDCVEDVLEMQAEWSKWREVEDSPSLKSENKAVARVLEMWDSLPDLVGGAIHVNGNVIAYTIGEEIGPDTMVVHFEKGMPAYKGVYQAINNCFAKAIAETKKFIYLNREQDMDDAGLRRAKESYNPVKYIKKYSIRILPRG